jgi:predicted membrane GTPase involved in stress response
LLAHAPAPQPTGELLEPYEAVVIDIDEEHSGLVIERMASRKGSVEEFHNHGAGKSRLTFRAPSRGLIGFQSELKTETRGSATVHRIFDGYGPYIRGLDRKPRAAMVSNGPGQVTAYALDGVQSRGTLFVKPGDLTYCGHIVGECSRDSMFDMEVGLWGVRWAHGGSRHGGGPMGWSRVGCCVRIRVFLLAFICALATCLRVAPHPPSPLSQVNVVKGKKLTNIRAAGTDDMIRCAPLPTPCLPCPRLYLY